MLKLLFPGHLQGGEGHGDLFIRKHNGATNWDLSYSFLPQSWSKQPSWPPVLEQLW